MRISSPLALSFVVVVAAACGGKTPLPKGPPPEYEQEPAPGDESADAGAAAPEASTAPVADAAQPPAP